MKNNLSWSRSQINFPGDFRPASGKFLSLSEHTKWTYGLNSFIFFFLLQNRWPVFRPFVIIPDYDRRESLGTGLQILMRVSPKVDRGGNNLRGKFTALNLHNVIYASSVSILANNSTPSGPLFLSLCARLQGVGRKEHRSWHVIT